MTLWTVQGDLLFHLATQQKQVVWNTKHYKIPELQWDDFKHKLYTHVLQGRKTAAYYNYYIEMTEV